MITPRFITDGNMSEMSGGFLPWRMLAFDTESRSMGI
jgi:hypothetical protein